MKITVNKKEFVSALADVLKVVPKRPIMPITSQGLMRLAPSNSENELGDMVIAGTDMAHMIFKSLNANIQGEKKDIVFDIEKTHALCKKISGDTIAFEITDKGLVIKSPTGKYDIPFIETDASLFPVLAFQKEDQNNAKIITAETKVFVDAVTRASKYVDEKGLSLVPALHCVYMVFGKENTVVYATDKTYVTKMTAPMKSEEEAEVMIDFNTVKYLSLLDGDDVTVAYAQGIYSLISGSTKVIGRCTDLKYPNIAGLTDGIVKGLTAEGVIFEFSKEMLSDSVDRLSALLTKEQGVPQVAITLHKAEMNISVYDANTAAQGEETHECQVNSDNKIKIKLDSNNLMTILNSFEGDTLTFMVKDMATQVDKPLFIKQSNNGFEMVSLLFPLCNV